MARSGHIKALNRRADFLRTRISETNGSYDKAEFAAILWAISQIENEENNVYQNRAFVNGQLVVLKKYKEVLRKAVHSGNVQSLEYLLEWTNDLTKQLKRN